MKSLTLWFTGWSLNSVEVTVHSHFIRDMHLPVHRLYSNAQRRTSAGPAKIPMDFLHHALRARL